MEWLADDILLLAVRDNGRLYEQGPLYAALASAELVMLAAYGRVDIQAGRIIVKDGGPTGEPLLDAALASMTGYRRPPTVHAWVARNPRNRYGLVDSHLELLAAAGTIAARRYRVLGMFPVTRWDVTDPARRNQAWARLDTIVSGAGHLGLEQVALAGLTGAMGLDVLYYSRAERKQLMLAGSAARSPGTAVEAATSAAIFATARTLRQMSDDSGLA